MTQPTLPEIGPESAEALSDLAHEHGGAPRERGPVGLIQAIFSGATSPSAKIWMGPLAKGAGTLFILGCIAFIGQRAHDDERYGSKIAVQLPSQGDESALNTESHTAAGEAKHEPAQATDSPGTTQAPAPCAENPQKAPSGVLPDGRVVLNEATAEDLTRLPGVGPARAEAIVALRTRLGRFKKLTDLLRVRGIGIKTLRRFTDQLVLDRPEEIEAQEKPQEEGQGAAAPATGSAAKTQQTAKIASVVAP